MKKKLIMGVAILSMAISFVGCSTASASVQNSVDEVSTTCYTVGRGFTYPNEDYYVEVPSVVGSSNGAYEGNHNYFEIMQANNQIWEDFSGNGIYTEPINVILTGEIKDGKTYFYYDGYATLDGVTEDYNLVVVMDYELNAPVYDFNLYESMYDNFKDKQVPFTFDD